MCRLLGVTCAWEVLCQCLSLTLDGCAAVQQDFIRHPIATELLHNGELLQVSDAIVHVKVWHGAALGRCKAAAVRSGQFTIGSNHKFSIRPKVLLVLLCSLQT